jgi:hypothetical protein
MDEARSSPAGFVSGNQRAAVWTDVGATRVGARAMLDLLARNGSERRCRASVATADGESVIAPLDRLGLGLTANARLESKGAT